jgi:hypothetical protein
MAAGSFTQVMLDVQLHSLRIDPDAAEIRQAAHRSSW